MVGYIAKEVPTLQRGKRLVYLYLSCKIYESILLVVVGQPVVTVRQDFVSGMQSLPRQLLPSCHPYQDGCLHELLLTACSGRFIIGYERTANLSCNVHVQSLWQHMMLMAATKHRRRRTLQQVTQLLVYANMPLPPVGINIKIAVLRCQYWRLPAYCFLVSLILSRGSGLMPDA